MPVKFVTEDEWISTTLADTDVSFDGEFYSSTLARDPSVPVTWKCTYGPCFGKLIDRVLEVCEKLGCQKMISDNDEDNNNASNAFLCDREGEAMSYRYLVHRSVMPKELYMAEWDCLHRFRRGDEEVIDFLKNQDLIPHKCVKSYVWERMFHSM